MASIIRINGHRYVAGLIWRALPDNASGSSAINDALREEVAEHGVIVRSGTEAVVGLVRKADFEGGFSGVVSIATAAARAVPTGFIILQADRAFERASEQWWLCAVSNGTVLPGFDVVGSKDSIKARLEQELSTYDGWEVHAPRELHAELPGHTLVALESLIDLSQPLEGQKVVKLRKTSPTSYLAMLVVLLAVGLGGYMLFEKLKPPPPEPEIPPGVPPEEVFRQNVEAHRIALLGALNGSLPSSRTTWVRQMRDTLWAMPRRHSGYAWTSSQCNYTGSCRMEYRSAGTLDLRRFEGRFAPMAQGDIVFPMDGNGANFQMLVPVQAGDVSQRDEAWLLGAPTYKDFIRELVHRFNTVSSIRSSGFIRSGGEPTPLTIVAPVLPAIDIPPPDWFGRTYLTGTITLQITEMWMVDHLLYLLDSPYVSWTTFNLSPEGASPTLTIEATYVVHTGSGT